MLHSCADHRPDVQHMGDSAVQRHASRGTASPLWGRSLLHLTRQGRHGAVTGMDAPLRTVHVDHAALECFNGGDGARAHDPINDEGSLRCLDVSVEEGLYQTDIVCAIEATTTNGGHKSIQLKLLSMLRCGGDVATCASGTASTTWRTAASEQREMPFAGILQRLVLQCLHKCIR